MDVPRPRQHLITASKRYPGAWRAYDTYRARRGRDLPFWPDWCYVPMAAAYAIVSGGGSEPVSPKMIREVGCLASLAAWRPTQSIYRFDPTVYAALIDTPLTGELPSDALYRLPEWCVYIETPSMMWLEIELHGFFAHLEWDANTAQPELRLLLDSAVALSPIPVHIGRWSLAEAVSRAVDLSRAYETTLSIPVPGEAKRVITNALTPLLSLLLYLCADEPEIGDGPSKPGKPRAKRTKHGWRLFAPDNATTWRVGVCLGAALRRGDYTGERALHDSEPPTARSRPRAHVRRAHWHVFLAGPGRNERRIKWLAHMLVNVDRIDDLPSTVRPVE